MAYELVYTSVPRGIRAGSTGFCTVAYTDGLSASLVMQLESISAYKPCFPHFDAQAALNPISFSHYVFNASGIDYHVLSRICFYGLDYTKRSNKLAHHVLCPPNEWMIQMASPADISAIPGFFRENWTGEPVLFKAQKTLVNPQTITRGKCQLWEQTTGDAGWAAKLAQSYLDQPERPCFVIFDPLKLQTPLQLVAEALGLLPQNLRWQVTYNTYLTMLPVGVRCDWRFCLPNADALKDARRIPGAVVIDLTQPLGSAGEGFLEDAARTGNDPFPMAAPQLRQVSMQPVSVADTPNFPSPSPIPVLPATPRATPMPHPTPLPPSPLAPFPKQAQIQVPTRSKREGSPRQRWRNLMQVIIPLLALIIGFFLGQNMQDAPRKIDYHSEPKRHHDLSKALLKAPHGDDMTNPDSSQDGERSSETAPKAPKASAPKAPKASAPKAPKASAPKAPKASAPKAPTASAPKAPKASAPKAPVQAATPTHEAEACLKNRRMLWYDQNLRNIHGAGQSFESQTPVIRPQEKIVAVVVGKDDEEEEQSVQDVNNTYKARITEEDFGSGNSVLQCDYELTILDDGRLRIENKLRNKTNSPQKTKYTLRAVKLATPGAPQRTTIWCRFKPGECDVPPPPQKPENATLKRKGNIVIITPWIQANHPLQDLLKTGNCSIKLEGEGFSSTSSPGSIDLSPGDDLTNSLKVSCLSQKFDDTQSKRRSLLSELMDFRKQLAKLEFFKDAYHELFEVKCSSKDQYERPVWQKKYGEQYDIIKERRKTQSHERFADLCIQLMPLECIPPPKFCPQTWKHLKTYYKEVLTSDLLKKDRSIADNIKILQKDIEEAEGNFLKRCTLLYQYNNPIMIFNLKPENQK